MALAGVAQLFEDPNQTGRNTMVALGVSQRYQLLRETDLLSDSLDHAVSSTTVFRPAEGATSLICFGFPIPTLFDFTGSFVQLTSLAGGAPVSTNMSSFGFDDLTSSALLVNVARGPETRLSFRTLFLSQWNTLIDAQLAGTRASRKDGSNPILTWEMFPQSIPGLDPALRYLRITQALNIDVPAWYDYDASLTYWVLLSIDSGGKIEGFVARTGYWVDSGVKHDKIAAELGPQVETGAGILNIELAKQLAPFRSFTLTDLYYLPGDQTGGSPAGSFTGTTVDDVTIVLQTR